MPTKAAVRSEQAPAPFAGAPYSQAIRVGDLVFVSGQIPLKPGSTVQVAAIPAGALVEIEAIAHL
jgi:enamine deaminase RidA (YjgF/YER057c/UK114 family)